MSTNFVAQLWVRGGGEPDLFVGLSRLRTKTDGCRGFHVVGSTDGNITNIDLELTPESAMLLRAELADWLDKL